MSLFSMRNWLLVSLVLGLSPLLAPVPSASAAVHVPTRPTAEQVLEICLDDLDRVEIQAQDKIDIQVERAQFYIETLASRGATQTKLNKVAKSYKKNISNIARSGQAQSTRIVGKGMIRMRSSSGYEREMQDTLFFERDRTIQTLRESVQDAAAQIDATLAGAADIE